jgi:thioredoxin reductase
MTVIGAGSYGTALAITLARNGHDVVLWGHDPKHIATLQHDRCNVAFLPDVPFLIPAPGKRSRDRAGGQPQHSDCGAEPCLWRSAASD